jgi:hypothetical protein
MKKMLFIAAFGVAGLVSAKNAEIKTFPKDNSLEVKVVESKDSKLATKFGCYQYGIVIGCTNEMVVDTACGNTFAEAQACMNHNAALLNEFMCGN